MTTNVLESEIIDNELMESPETIVPSSQNSVDEFHHEINHTLESPEMENQSIKHIEIPDDTIQSYEEPVNPSENVQTSPKKPKKISRPERTLPAHILANKQKYDDLIERQKNILESKKKLSVTSKPSNPSKTVKSTNKPLTKPKSIKSVNEPATSRHRPNRYPTPSTTYAPKKPDTKNLLNPSPDNSIDTSANPSTDNSTPHIESSPSTNDADTLPIRRVMIGDRIRYIPTKQGESVPNRSNSTLSIDKNINQKPNGKKYIENQIEKNKKKNITSFDDMRRHSITKNIDQKIDTSKMSLQELRKLQSQTRIRETQELKKKSEIQKESPLQKIMQDTELSEFGKLMAIKDLSKKQRNRKAETPLNI